MRCFTCYTNKHSNFAAKQDIFTRLTRSLAQPEATKVARPPAPPRKSLIFRRTQCQACNSYIDVAQALQPPLANQVSFCADYCSTSALFTPAKRNAYTQRLSMALCMSEYQLWLYARALQRRVDNLSHTKHTACPEEYRRREALVEEAPSIVLLLCDHCSSIDLDLPISHTVTAQDH